MWEIEGTDEFEGWYLSLDSATQGRIDLAVDRLEQSGPMLGRPTVGEVAGSRLHNLKELRPAGSTVRILFLFDPRRTAILLVGGDKSEHGWTAWYRTAIAEAEQLYDTYIEELRKEGLLE